MLLNTIYPQFPDYPLAGDCEHKALRSVGGADESLVSLQGSSSSEQKVANKEE